MERRYSELRGYLALARIRAVYQTVAAIAAITALGWIVGGREFHVHQESDFAVPWLILLPFGSAAAIAASLESEVTVWEAASPRLVGRLVGAFVLALTGVAAVGVAVDTAGLSGPYSLPTALRNLFAFLGAGLICGRAFGPRLSWLAPLVWALASLTVGSGADNAGVTRIAIWAWPLLPDGGSAAIPASTATIGSAALFIFGLAASCHVRAGTSRNRWL